MKKIMSILPVLFISFVGILGISLLTVTESVAAGITPTGAAADAEEAADNGEPFIEQQILVENETSGSDGIGGIYLPPLMYQYTMTPVTDTSIVPSGGVYSTDPVDFPTNAAGGKEQVSILSGLWKDQKSDSDGTQMMSLSARYFFENPGNTIFPKEDTVLCYKVVLSNVYLEPEDTSGVAQKELSSDTAYMILPAKKTIYCDFYINEKKEIGKVVCWNEARTGKVKGFSDGYVDGYEPQSDAASGLSSNNTPGLLTYKVYDAEFTTDYIGASKISDDMNYMIRLSYVGWWLKGRLSEQTEVESGNVWDGGGGDLSDTGFSAITFVQGKLDSRDSVVLKGIPLDVDGLETKIAVRVTFSSINGLSHDNNDAAILKLVRRTYAGTTNRIAESTDSLTKFNQLSDRTAYEDVSFSWDTNSYSGTAVSKPLTTTVGDGTNNLRLVMFDPTEAIVVGVAMDFLPGILMIGLALGGVAAIGISRRRDVAF